ncbi:MAG: hypothetical protein HYT20_00100 [Candidatus Nealsonbacteria bacterium]|nr:hypothetical protein [Candidatus Nealsonbacteria bacterium]
MRKIFRFNKIPVFFLIFFGLFFCLQQANAFFDVIPSLASMQLDALDFLDRIVAWLFYLLMFALAGGFFISFSAAFLDWASSLPVGLNNDLVNAGWHFTSGLVNMSFILIFIFIAISYIFKAENVGMKKALPRLIVIALLVNFSLLLVKMVADMGWVVQNAFKQSFFGTAGMAVPIASQMAGAAAKAVGEYAAWFFAPYYIVALIPFANVARLIFFGTAVLGEGLFGTFSETFILGAFSIVGGLVFLVYALLFLLRIAIIWLLAVSAPLAFAAYILPQTQKYFRQWLGALFQWTFLGVVVFFVMGLGLKFFAAVAPATAFNIRGTNLAADYSKFIFLIVYLVFTLTIAKKMSPAAMDDFWKLGGMAISGGTGYLAGKAKQATLRGRTWQEGERAKAAERIITPLKAKEAAGTITPREQSQLGAWTRRREIAQAKIRSIEEATLAEDKARILKRAPKDTEDRRNYLQAELLKEDSKKIARSSGKIAAIIDIITKEGKIGANEEKFIAEAVRKGVSPDKIMERRPDLAPKIGKTIIEALDKMTTKDLLEKTQKEAYQNSEVVVHILEDDAKFEDITRHAKPEIKKEILKTLNNATSLPIGLGKQIKKMSTNPKWKV